tara:strand:- start:123 stop:692 length:570 start_codon:yes stop_codon:yes gene_type:complete
MLFNMRFYLMRDIFLEQLSHAVRTIPNFPIDGVLFRDITPILTDHKMLTQTIDTIALDMMNLDWYPDIIVGPEARGFIFGPLLSTKLGKGFVPIRKPGKLPSSTLKIDYELEYGSNSLEIHDDAILPGQKVVIIDDLLATGGTIAACIELCKQLNAEIIGVIFIIELEGLGARKLLSSVPLHSLLKFPA